MISNEDLKKRDDEAKGLISNEDLKKKRESKELTIFNQCLEFLVNTDEGKDIVKEVTRILPQTAIITIVKTFSKMCAKTYNEIVIQIVHDKTAFEQHIMVDAYDNVTYSRSIQQFEGYQTHTPGGGFVSYSQGNEFSLSKPAIIDDNLQILPFMSVVKMDGIIVNELSFYMKGSVE